MSTFRTEPPAVPESNYDAKVRRAIAASRRKCGMTQDEFAQSLSEEMGDGRQIRGHWISRWESGAYMPKGDIVLAAMAISGATPLELGVDPRAASTIEIKEHEREARRLRAVRAGRDVMTYRSLPVAHDPVEAYLTLAKAAAEMGKSRQWMHTQRERGILPAYRLGNHPVFLKTDVEQLRKKRESAR